MAIWMLRPDDQIFLCIFGVLKWLYLSQSSLINTKLGDFVNLGVLFLTIGINNPIIYRLVQSPFQREN